MISSKARLYQVCTCCLIFVSLMTRKRQRCVLPPFGAHTPACKIFRISSSGTGSGLSRRIARVVCMISNRSVASGILLSPLAGERGPHALGEVHHLLVKIRAVGGEKLEDEVLHAALRELVDLVDEGGRLASEHASRMGGRRRLGPGREDADVVAKRDGRGRRPSAQLGQPRELRAARAQLRRRAIDRVPGGAEAHGPPQRGG